MGLETVIFGKKTFSDLLKEIYDNSKAKDRQITTLISELKPLMTDIGEARLVVPMIKEYLEVGVKNDEHLIKMAAIVQRAEGAKGDMPDFISPEELAKLVEQSEELGKDLDKKE